ncbi:MAG TPA: hypothetical protein PLQ36_00715, partial [Candidatus Gracilibacteria bacterium]|nr:hypothetical protein [Candidatus Gracilibacteria bacterium]
MYYSSHSPDLIESNEKISNYPQAKKLESLLPIQNISTEFQGRFDEVLNQNSILQEDQIRQKIENGESLKPDEIDVILEHLSEGAYISPSRFNQFFSDLNLNIDFQEEDIQEFYERFKNTIDLPFLDRLKKYQAITEHNKAPLVQVILPHINVNNNFRDFNLDAFLWEVIEKKYAY